MGIDSSTDLADMVSSALPSIGTESLEYPIRKINDDKNSSSVSNFLIIKHSNICKRLCFVYRMKVEIFRNVHQVLVLIIKLLKPIYLDLLLTIIYKM